MRDGGAAVRDTLEILVVNPDAVRGGEVGPEQTKGIDMRREGLAVSSDPRHGLDLGFPEMHLHADVIFLRQVPAGDQKRVAAIKRDRGGKCGAHARSIEGPLSQKLPTYGDRGLEGCRLQLGHAAT